MDLTKNNPSETPLIQYRDKAEQQRVRAVHAVLMRWIIEGTSVDEILREQPQSLQQFAAQRRVKDVQDAKSGSQASIKALDRLITLIDGGDEDDKPQSPVTLIERHIENADGSQTRVREVREVRHGVQLLTEDGDSNEQ